MRISFSPRYVEEIYLNVVVLILHSILKFQPIHAVIATQKGTALLIVRLIVLALFVVSPTLATMNFHPSSRKPFEKDLACARCSAVSHFISGEEFGARILAALLNLFRSEVTGSRCLSYTSSFGLGSVFFKGACCCPP